MGIQFVPLGQRGSHLLCTALGCCVLTVFLSLCEGKKKGCDFYTTPINRLIVLNINIYGAYTKLNNKYFENWLRKSREKFGVIGFKTSDTVRGIQKNMQYMGRQVMITYEIPLNEVVLDFFDRLKSVSRGYASMDYEFMEFRAADLIKLDIMVNGDRVDALSLIVHRSNSISKGRELASKMRSLIPRQMFDVAIQSAIGANIIARETIKALRKNVIAKCYGGDVSRKRKLLEKQKAGKKRMKQVGNVEIPQEAFLAILQVDD